MQYIIFSVLTINQKQASSNSLICFEQDLDTLREEAINLLELIKTKECFDHLMNIRQGITRTSRHQKFSSNQEVLGCFGPFTIFDDLVSGF